MEHAVDLYDRSGDPRARAVVAAISAVRHAIMATRDTMGMLAIAREILAAECRELAHRAIVGR
jgi:hypothetical protein